MNPPSEPRLPGTAATDYERYLRTDELLSLQKSPEQAAHRDEPLFQTVHQCAELWLKQAAVELEGAAGLVEAAHLSDAARLLEKAADAISCVNSSTRMLRHLSSADYHAFRPNLGNGSGFDSPGFKRVMTAAAALEEKLGSAIAAAALNPAEVAANRAVHPGWHGVTTRMLDIDQLVAEWRHIHFQLVQKLLGADAIGLLGMPVGLLAQRLNQKLFPSLWQGTAAAKADS